MRGYHFSLRATSMDHFPPGRHEGRGQVLPTPHNGWMTAGKSAISHPLSCKIMLSDYKLLSTTSILLVGVHSKITALFFFFSSSCTWSQQTFSVKGQINILGFVGHMASTATVQF